VETGLVPTGNAPQHPFSGDDPESRAYLASIVESSDDAIISKDLNGIIRTFNAGAERLFGYTREEIVGKPVTILIPADRQDEEADILRRIRAGQRVDHFETVRRAKDGRLLDISLTISPVRDATGTIVGASKVARDITELKRVAHALAAQGEWFRVTLGSIGDAVIASDQTGRVTFLNPAAERLTGWRNTEAFGKPLVEVATILDEATRQPVYDPVDLTVQGGGSVDPAKHTLLRGRDGTEWPFDHTAALILDDQGEVLGVVLVCRDVTAKRQAESERLAAAAERDRLLESERAARGDAERANRVKDDFVAMVSHELRTPLNAIVGWTDFLLNTRPEANTLQHGLEIVARNARVQTQLISDLLDISRIVSGKLWLDSQTVDLNATIDSSIESVVPSAQSKKVEIQRETESNVGTLTGDPARLQQVVWNLLTNAIKFTPAGGRIRVRLRRVGEAAEITVSDTGAGIPPHLIPNLFERFRHTSVTTRSHGGLGLGLSIVKHLVELHGGTVRVESEGEGKGSTFTLTIPLTSRRAAAAAAPSMAGDTDAAPGPNGSLRDVAVLLVEDEPDTRDLVRRILEHHGAKVDVVGTAEAALRALAAGPPRLLISDIGLPEVDGYELMRRIRLMEWPLSAIPAVALTAFARPEDRTRALRAGYQTHLAKPVEPSELLSTVVGLLDAPVPAPKS
jgi:PAS domain S-box-containing protein